MEKFVLDILKATNFKYGDIAKKRWGESPQILVGDLFLAIITYRTGEKVADKLGISRPTFHNIMRKLFPNTNLLGKHSWSAHLLWLANYKYCYVCDTILSRESFWPKVESWDGLRGECKDCSVRLHRTIYKNTHKELNAKRRAAKLQRTPPWADTEKIKQIYKNCPEGYHVDHIVPLQGKNVSGLHVENNLQYLTKSENSSKGNKF